MSATTTDDSDVYLLGGHSLRLLHTVRVLMAGRHQIRLSPTEYRILRVLLDGHPLSDRELAATLFETKSDFWTRETVEKHMDNIRRKLRKEQFPVHIHRLLGYGYMLVPVEQRAAS